jgi:hypothetical protein
LAPPEEHHTGADESGVEDLTETSVENSDEPSGEPQQTAEPAAKAVDSGDHGGT